MAPRQPNMAQDAPKTAQHGPRWPQDNPRWQQLLIRWSLDLLSHLASKEGRRQRRSLQNITHKDPIEFSAKHIHCQIYCRMVGFIMVFLPLVRLHRPTQKNTCKQIWKHWQHLINMRKHNLQHKLTKSMCCINTNKHGKNPYVFLANNTNNADNNTNRTQRARPYQSLSHLPGRQYLPKPHISNEGRRHQTKFREVLRPRLANLRTRVMGAERAPAS
jgi:hypothetical protein